MGYPIIHFHSFSISARLWGSIGSSVQRPGNDIFENYSKKDGHQFRWNLFDRTPFLRNVPYIIFAHRCFVNVDTPRHQSVDDNLRSSEFPNNRCKQFDDRINGWLIIIFIWSGIVCSGAPGGGGRLPCRGSKIRSSRSGRSLKFSKSQPTWS